MQEESLAGGFAHPGAVVRVGNTVRRPPSEFRDAINALLEFLDGSGAIEVPRPLGKDDQGREAFSFVEGDVPIPPYPPWAVTDDALRSIGRLLRRFHDAVAGFEPGEHRWPGDLTDPAGGTFVCHNDVCLENVVFRDGEAVGLLDFDFAAPGRRLYDAGMTLRMCGPVRDPRNIPEEFGDIDPVRRAALFCESYGVEQEEAEELIDGLRASMTAGRAFVKRRAEAGEPWFEETWQAGGPGRYDRDETWIEQNRDALLRALSGND